MKNTALIENEDLVAYLKIFIWFLHLINNFFFWNDSQPFSSVSLGQIKAFEAYLCLLDDDEYGPIADAAKQ